MSLTVVYTGGTIGGKREGKGPLARDHGAAAFGKLLNERLPPQSVPLRVEGVLGKLSENLEPDDWAALARLIDGHVRGGAAGIVVAHGTDTLIYSACALRWLLDGIPVPVVVTGSNHPLEAPDSDAVQNLSHALTVAGQARRPGVWISFAGKPGAGSLILDPRNTCKQAGRPDCFQPVWGRAEGTVGARSNRVSWRLPVVTGPAAYTPRFTVEPGVALFTVHPGFQPAWIEQAVRRNVRAIVLAGYGSGTACASGAFDLRPALRLAAEKGVAVWMVSQHGGRVGPVYGSTAALVREGVSLRPGWTPEAALTALMCRRDLDALSPRA